MYCCEYLHCQIGVLALQDWHGSLEQQGIDCVFTLAKVMFVNQAWLGDEEGVYVTTIALGLSMD